MDPQQPNTDGYTKVNAEETNPDVQFSFEQKDSAESNVRHRAFVSGNEAADPSSSTQDKINTLSKPQRKKLSTLFSSFYGAVLVLYTLASGYSLFEIINWGIQGLGFDKFDFFVEGWLFVQCILAFIGFWKKDLGKIEKALTMIKIHFLLMIISELSRLFEAMALQRTSRTRSGNPVSDTLLAGAGLLILFTILIFLPTRKVRNTWKVTPEEEEMGKEKAQEIDPIEKLDSVKFIIFKYVLLISFCGEIKVWVPAVYQDFSDLPKFWGDMMAETSYLVTQGEYYILSPLSLILTFLAFEGLRKRNLEKILTSIKLMKIHFVSQFIIRSLVMIAEHFEGNLRERFQNLDPKVEIENEAMLLFLCLSQVVLVSLACFVFIYITSQIRDILKTHQKARHTL